MARPPSRASAGSLTAHLRLRRESRQRGGSSTRLVPCPLSGEEANPARPRAFPRARNPFHLLFNAARTEEIMSKLHRSLLGAVLGAGLAIGGTAHAKRSEGVV